MDLISKEIKTAFGAARILAMLSDKLSESEEIANQYLGASERLSAISKEAFSTIKFCIENNLIPDIPKRLKELFSIELVYDTDSDIWITQLAILLVYSDKALGIDNRPLSTQETMLGQPSPDFYAMAEKSVEQGTAKYATIYAGLDEQALNKLKDGIALEIDKLDITISSLGPGESGNRSALEARRTELSYQQIAILEELTRAYKTEADRSISTLAPPETPDFQNHYGKPRESALLSSASTNSEVPVFHRCVPKIWAPSVDPAQGLRFGFDQKNHTAKIHDGSKYHYLDRGDIINCAIVEDVDSFSERQTSSIVKRGALGAVLLGEVGAVVGGLTAKTNTKILVKSVSVHFYLALPEASFVSLEFLDRPATQGSPEYRLAMEYAQRTLSLAKLLER